MVLQKNVLFTGKLIENLRWGNEKASLEEVKEACMVEINGDLSKYAEYIASFYRDTLGYDVLLITNKTSIDGKPLEWIDTTYYMIISWERNKDIGKPDVGVWSRYQIIQRFAVIFG